MVDNQFFQVLVYSALVFFNLIFIIGFIIALYALVVIGSIKGKIDELYEQIKSTLEKMSEAASNASEAAANFGSVIGPVAIMKGFFKGNRKKQGEEKGFFSKLFS